MYAVLLFSINHSDNKKKARSASQGTAIACFTIIVHQGEISIGVDINKDIVYISLNLLASKLHLMLWKIFNFSCHCLNQNMN